MINLSLAPLKLGKEITVLNKTAPAAGSDEVSFIIESDTVLVSLQASVVTGDLDVDVFTEGTDGVQVRTINFPTLTAPTTDLVLRKASATMQKIVVKVTYTGSCSFIIRARGTATGEASFRILGNNDLLMSQKDVSTTAVSLIAAGLTDRSSVAVKNNNTTGILYVGGSAGEATTTDGWPVGPQEVFVVDIAAGQELYGIADAGTIDVRLSESGG